MTARKCHQCGELITYTANPAARYCSRSCQQRADTIKRAGRRNEDHNRQRRERRKAKPETVKVITDSHKIAQSTDRPKPMFCETCKIKAPRDRHHDDYNQPDVYRWLCRSCHMKWHRQNKPAGLPENLLTDSRTATL